MILGFTPDQLIDFGFMGLVVFTCARSLMSGNSDSEGNRERWQGELKELEATLRGLIAEAGSASSALDRSLLQRKRELEALLEQLSAQEQRVTAEPKPVQGYNRTKRAVRPEPTAAPELPNDTWTAPPPSEKPARERAAEIPAARPAPAPRAAAASFPQPAAPAWSLGAEAGEPTLASQVEVLTEEAERETFAKMSIMDPVTYKIARRLLNQGKEIHVVARKLELPVSEIRLLDRLMRREQNRPEDDAENESQPLSERRALVPQESDFEQDLPEEVAEAASIMRESALL